MVFLAGRGVDRWLVVAIGVDGQFSQDLAGGVVDDADVQVLGEDEYVGSGVGSPDADVVHAAVETQGDGSAVIDAVGADPVVRVVLA